MKIILTGNPRSTGTLYKTMCRSNFPKTYLIQAGADLKADYAKQARMQWRWPIIPIEKGVEVYVRLYFGNKRKNDIDNFHKLSFDACTGIIWEDDSQIWKMTVAKFLDKTNPRIEIDISEAL